MRPRIGVTSWHRPDGDGLERWEAIRDTYTGAIRAAGGLPIILPIADDDPELVGEVLRVIRELGEEGRTMIMVTHDKELSRRVPRVVEITDGKITRDEFVGGAIWTGY